MDWDAYMRIVRIGFWLAWMTWAMAAHASGPEAKVILTSGEEKKVLACLPLEAGHSIRLEFINSIYLAPVRETFLYQPGEGLVLVEVDSPSAGVFEYYGLPFEKSGTVIMRRNVGQEIRLLSSDYQNHRLIVGERSLPLKGLVADGEPLIVRVQRGGRCGL